MSYCLHQATCLHQASGMQGVQELLQPSSWPAAQLHSCGALSAACPARSEAVAIDCLKVSAWGVEGAIDHFYSSGISAQVLGVDARAIDTLFSKYKGTQAGRPADRGSACQCGAHQLVGHSTQGALVQQFGGGRSRPGTCRSRRRHHRR